MPKALIARAYANDFNEDYIEGAVRSLYTSISRIKWRRSDGRWPSEAVGKLRTAMEKEIELLIEAEIERRCLGEVEREERNGPVIHRQRKGRMRMTPKKVS